MKINVTFPFDRLDCGDEFIGMEAVATIAQAAERAGFTAGCVTDHPCPSGRWLDNGGHHAQDPFVMLSMVAAVTTKLRLQTGILVLPYRNPFITARAVATLDVFSQGRVTLGFGAGYMKAEYRALGVNFEKRNELMDEYIQAMKAAWTGEEFTFKGDGYEALGNRILPAPHQRPHPPLLIGGNSHRAIRRAVEMGDGWNPFFTPKTMASTARTAAMSDDMDIAEGIAYMKTHCEKIGRATPPEIILASLTHPGDDDSPQALLDKIGQFAAIGVTGCAVHIDAGTRREWCDKAQHFGEEIIAKL
jgi:probable F420-dependent oxidoreductase